MPNPVAILARFWYTFLPPINIPPASRIVPIIKITVEYAMVFCVKPFSLYKSNTVPFLFSSNAWTVNQACANNITTRHATMALSSIVMGNDRFVCIVRT